MKKMVCFCCRASKKPPKSKQFNFPTCLSAPSVSNVLFFSSLSQLHTDMDRNDGRTKYVLRGEGAGSVFVIDEKTGNIHVTKPLDREEKDEYRLIATATDRQTDRALEPSSQFIIRVQDINDNPPVFDEGPYSATVPEMANIGGCGFRTTFISFSFLWPSHKRSRCVYVERLCHCGLLPR